MKKEHLRWLVWLLALGVLFFMGRTWTHINNLAVFLPIILLLPVLMIIAFRALKDENKGKN